MNENLLAYAQDVEIQRYQDKNAVKNVIVDFLNIENNVGKQEYASTVLHQQFQVQDAAKNIDIKKIFDSKHWQSIDEHAY